MATRLSLTSKLVALVLGFTVLNFAAFGSEGFDPFDPSQTVTFGSTIFDATFEADDDFDAEAIGRDYEDISITRGPLVAGTFAVTPTITSTFPNDLLSARLLVADDTNANGHIEWSEWRVAGVASVATVGGVTTATFLPMVISATKDAYRLEVVSMQDGVHGYTLVDDREMTWDMEP